MELMKFEPNDYLAIDLISDSIKVLEPAVKNKHQDLITTGPNFLIHVDQRMFQSVIRNLVGNAIKFTPDKGQITIETDITVDNNFAQITVSDTGAGILPSLIDDIFAVDKKTTTLGTHGEVGTGLGLPLTKELVERNGGTIWVETTQQQGTHFTFTVPLAGHEDRH